MEENNIMTFNESDVIASKEYLMISIKKLLVRYVGLINKFNITNPIFYLDIDIAHKTNEEFEKIELKELNKLVIDKLIDKPVKVKITWNKIISRYASLIENLGDNRPFFHLKVRQWKPKEQMSSLTIRKPPVTKSWADITEEEENRSETDEFADGDILEIYRNLSLNIKDCKELIIQFRTKGFINESNYWFKRLQMMENLNLN
jgi:hypothetical protein